MGTRFGVEQLICATSSIVVVDDGSSDTRRETTAEWMDGPPWIPARLVRPRRSTGGSAPPATRRRISPGRPYCFVLDADNEVYPRCLDALAWALDCDPWCCVRVSDARGVRGDSRRSCRGRRLYRRACSGWEPERLRLGNYIDALVDDPRRAACASSAGSPPTVDSTAGRTTTCGAVWLSAAGADSWFRRSWRAIGRRSGSMVSTTNLSTDSAMAAMIEHAPRLMAGIRPPV